MFSKILVLLAFFGGILFYLINLLTFEQRLPRIYSFLSFICSLIPLVGIVTFAVLYLYNVFNYQTCNFYTCYDSKAVVRDTKLNRFLFNDVDWEDYEHYMYEKQNKKQVEEK